MRADLTSRQTQIMDGVVLGRTNRQIALSLGISEHTVEHHLKVIFRRLGVASRTAAALAFTRAREAGPRSQRESGIDTSAHHP